MFKLVAFSGIKKGRTKESIELFALFYNEKLSKEYKNS